VLWGGEFGRTPTTENGDGAITTTTLLPSSSPAAASAAAWPTAPPMLGFRAVENKVHVHDLHAPICTNWG